MPGFEIDALNGKSFAKTMLEWNLPPMRFDDLGHSRLLRELVATGPVRDGTGDQSGRGRRGVDSYNVGLQFDMQLQVMHRLPMMLSFGYAHGFGGDGEGEDEFMLSFKVL